jgi:two-component system nitrate/nitrite response regulator NarL
MKPSASGHCAQSSETEHFVMASVAIVDDEADLRALTRLRLEFDLDCDIVGEAADGEQAVRLLSTTNADVAIVDLHLPKLSGIEVIRTVRAARIGVFLIAYSADEQGLTAASEAGADATVLKTGDLQVLVDRVREALAA